MECSKIIRQIEETFPPQYACGWDNVGLLVGDDRQQVHTVFLALDATDEVIEQAAAQHADMLITHHPLIFHGMKRVTADDFIGRRILRLAQEQIAYYAMHTNYDIAGMGMAAAKRLDLQAAQALEVTVEEDGERKGIGVCGELSHEMTLLECAKLVKERFGISNVRIFGDGAHIVKRAAVVPGSGGSDIRNAVQAGAQVYITGDISHHDGLDAMAQGLAVVDAGHYGLEHIFAGELEEFLKKAFGDEITVCRAREKEPYLTV